MFDRTHISDPKTVEWKRSSTEGVSFACQILLSGDDGGPEALRFRFDECPSVYAHMHLTSQFQLLIGGSMDFPRNNLNLLPNGVHYTDHNTPYGPFSVREGHDVLVLHPRQGGLMTMGNLEARRQINLTGRVLTGMDNEMEWENLPDEDHVRYKVLIPKALGPEATMLECKPLSLILSPPAQYGRYEVVLEGSVKVGGMFLEAPGLRYVESEERPEPLQAGPDGATMIFLGFDADALEGGLTNEGIAVEAAEAMARAI